MSRGRKQISGENSNAALVLLNALKFIQPATVKNGNLQETHCKFGDGWLAASNSILTIGVPVPERLQTAPHFQKLLNALERCGEKMSITQEDNETIIVKSGRWKAKIPCVRMHDIHVGPPQQQQAVVDDNIKTALATVVKLTDDSGDRPLLKAVHLCANMALATNGFAAVGYWHGIDLPPWLLIPPEAVKAVSNASKPLVGLGFSDTACTFLYDDGSFIKTQLYIGQYPDIVRILRPNFADKELPQGFFEAIKAVIPQCEADYVYINEKSVCSHFDKNHGAAMELEAMPTGADGQSFRYDMLLAMASNMHKVSFDDEARKLYFGGPDVTGVIMGQIKREPVKPAKRMMTGEEYAARQAERRAESGVDEDDIPF